MANDISAIDYTNETKTKRGTKIVKKGEELGKNAFLTILSAEMANQDPSKDTDSTQYVSQLAQFSALEQMSNLNSTMTKYANQGLIGKGVTLSRLDENGQPYTGVVRSVTSTNAGTKLSIEYNHNGKNDYLEDVTYDEVVSVIQPTDYTIPPLTNMNANMQLLLASSFIGKSVEISDKDSSGKSITGTIKSVFKDGNDVKVRLETASGEIKEVSYANITKVGDFATTK